MLDRYLGFIAIRTRFLKMLVPPNPDGCPVAPLKAAGGQIALSQDKLDQVTDGGFEGFLGLVHSLPKASHAEGPQVRLHRPPQHQISRHFAAVRAKLEAGGTMAGG